MYAAIKSAKTDANETFTRQRSLRRVLPAEHAKTHLLSRENEDFNKICNEIRQEYVILAEYKMLQSENLPGVYVIPSRESSFLWFGVIFVRTGPYEDGIFRFNILLDENFPDCQHPKVVFQSEIVHPVIHEDTNELHLLDAFTKWNKGKQHLWQVVKYISWIFNNFEASLAHSVNKEAETLYKDNREVFLKKVKDLVKASEEHIYDEPPCEDKHYLTFKPYQPEVHDPVRNSMLNQSTSEQSNSKGYSWVAPGSYKPLGRPPSPEFECES